MEFEECCENMLCTECGTELDYRSEDGNTCECECHTLI